MNNLRSIPHMLPRLRQGARAALVLIVLLATGLRAYHLGAQAIWWDESLSVYRATRDLGSVFSNIILIQDSVTYDTMPPLYFVLLHFLVSALGTTEFALRYLSLAANVATVPLLYALARRWFSQRIGVMAALIGALSPFYVAFAQEARPYALVLFLSTLAVYALARAFAAASSATGKAFDGRWISVYLCAATAALYTHYHALFLVPFHAVLIALLAWRRGAPRRLAWAFLPLLPVLAAVPLVPLVLASMAGNTNRGPSFVPLFIMLQDLLNSFSVGITADFAQMLWIDLALLAVFAVGVLLPGSTLGRRASLILLAYILLPALGVQAASYIRPLYQNSRYLITISPAFYLGVAGGMAALGQRWKLAALGSLAVFLTGAIISLDNLYFNPTYGKDDHRAWAEYLHEHRRAGDYVILDSPRTEELFRYYSRDRLPWRSLPVLNHDRADAPEADLDAIRAALSQHDRVWFLEMHVPFNDPDERIEKLLNQEGVLLDQMSFHGTSTALSLSLFAPALPTAAEISQRQSALFDGHLEFLGYAAPASIETGARGVVRLYWRVDQRVGEDYAVSLRLVDATGTRWGQWDGILLGSRAGTSTWPPGRIVEAAHDLPVMVGTRPGRYQLQIQVYHPTSGAVVGDELTLGEVAVTRPREPIDPSVLKGIRWVDQRLDGFRLLGADWPAEGARPGDALPVALYFQMTEKPRADLALTIDLFQPAVPFLPFGRTRAEARASIAGVDLQAGDILRQDVTLRLPADGASEYQVRAALANASPRTLGSVRVQPIPRGRDVPTISHPFSARVGDAITLLGYDVSAERVRAGDTLKLTLYWRADKTMDRSYKVFTHIVDASDRIYGQQDSIPAGGERPTTGWAPGEVIADPYVIALDAAMPPGEYAIEIGFYDEASGTRLPTFDASGASLGGRILLRGIEAQ